MEEKAMSMEYQSKSASKNLQAQDGGNAASGGSAAGARDAQMTQGVDLAHGNVSEAIASGESMHGNNNPYAAFNYYKSDGKLGSSYFGMLDGKPIDQMTFGELENLSQSGSTLNISYTDGDAPSTKTGRLFATGKYQMIPGTRESARGYVGLKKTDLYSPQNQDLCFTKYLIAAKRPQVMAYFNGTGSVEAAALAIAQEWAAIGIKPGRVNNNGKVGANNGLTSYYDGDGVNAASVSYERIVAALQADKAAIDAGGIATHTVDSTAGTPTSVIPAENASKSGDAGSSNAQSEAGGSAGGNVSVDLNRAVTRNRSYGYSKETWKEIQRAVGLTGSDVDGIVGKVTSQAIANWQANNGFTGNDVDGICGPKTLAAIRGGAKTEQPPKNDEGGQQEKKEEPKNDTPVTLDVDSAVKANKNFGYSRSTWKDVQTKVGLSGKDVDGYVGPTTTKAIARWQESNGLGGNGICDKATLDAMGIKPATDKAAQGVPTGGTGFMDNSYTPDLESLKNDAAQREPSLDITKTGDSAKYIARRGMSSGSLGQCTRGTALFLQLASYARGEANRTYAQACRASAFGSEKPMTSMNISSSVASEYTMSSGEDVTGNSAFCKQIENHISQDGEFVTFDYQASKKSFHIVFRADGGWYSDFKQGTASGINAGNGASFWNVHYFNK